MTINSEIKEKLKQKELEHERRWRRQQDLNVLKGLAVVFVLIIAIAVLSRI
jgi:hypothetical protein